MLPFGSTRLSIPWAVSSGRRGRLSCRRRRGKTAASAHPNGQATGDHCDQTSSRQPEVFS
ncbi:MAG TPA: hypothetical protein VG455_15830 [Acidimicrobiales bacterium]|nr:hypothetical protein [Acidimicrobiales bacterium]